MGYTPLQFDFRCTPLSTKQQADKPLFHVCETRMFPSPRIDLQTSEPGQKAAGLPTRNRLAVNCLLISRCEFDPTYRPNPKLSNTEINSGHIS